jgi:hypothetical protein
MQFTNMNELWKLLIYFVVWSAEMSEDGFSASGKTRRFARLSAYWLCRLKTLFGRRKPADINRIF